MGLADQLLLLLLWLVCVWCVNGPGLSVCLSAGWLAEWLSSECATLTSEYSMRMAGWPAELNRQSARWTGSDDSIGLTPGDGGWNRCSAFANGWNMVFG